MGTDGSLLGLCLAVGFDGTRPGPAERAALVRIGPGAVVVFRRNLDSPGRFAEFRADLDGLPTPPVIVALDQEGGRVSRLEPWIGATPSAAMLARSGDAATRRFGAATGLALRTLGFNADFAPVVDLSPLDANNGIGDRSFGTDPDQVARIAGAFLEGLQGTRVAGCLKHFPGLGRTMVDSHLERPRVDASLEDLERTDLIPYRALGGVAAMVMVGHACYPCLEPDGDRPASLSGRVISGILRQRMGFRGLVVSDDLEMGAVTGFEDDACNALGAGCDLLLYCRDLARAERAKRSIELAANSHPAFARRVAEAASRVTATARRFPLARPDLIAWERARTRIADESFDA